MTMRTPLSRVLHYGAAGGGTDHFWRQRLTGAANVPLVIALVVIVIGAIGEPYETAVTFLARPWVTLVLVLAFVSAAIHMRIGMQVVIEDYIHGEAMKVVLMLASTFFTVAVAGAAILAALRIAFGV